MILARRLLSTAEVPVFMAALREFFPQHFAMAYLGLITGLRPSTLRPLRRRGPECDVDWQEHRLRVRRSHTVGEEVMRTTKQRHRYSTVSGDEQRQALAKVIDLTRHASDVDRRSRSGQQTAPHGQ